MVALVIVQDPVPNPRCNLAELINPSHPSEDWHPNLWMENSIKIGQYFYPGG